MPASATQSDPGIANEPEGVGDARQPRLEPVGIIAEAGRVPGPVVIETQDTESKFTEPLGSSPKRVVSSEVIPAERRAKTTAPRARQTLRAVEPSKQEAVGRPEPNRCRGQLPLPPSAGSRHGQ